MGKERFLNLIENGKCLNFFLYSIWTMKNYNLLLRFASFLLGISILFIIYQSIYFDKNDFRTFVATVLVIISQIIIIYQINKKGI